MGSQTLEGFPDQRPSPGARISTLGEVLAHGLERAPDVWWTIELKVDPRDAGESATRRRLLEGVLASVHEAGLERQCFVHSFDWAVLELSARARTRRAPLRARRASETWVPGSPWTGSVVVGESHDDVCAGAVAVGAQVISPEHALVDADFVERAHAAGLAVLPWTVNDPERMVELVEAGVDGLVTDYPDRAASALPRVLPDRLDPGPACSEGPDRGPAPRSPSGAPSGGSRGARGTLVRSTGRRWSAQRRRVQQLGGDPWTPPIR